MRTASSGSCAGTTNLVTTRRNKIASHSHTIPPLKMGEEQTAGDNKLSEVTSQYTDGLLGLTFNSKPIINNLTIIAGENINASAEIVKLIEARIAQADDDKKLPVIYLLDSIIKNIGGVYLELFAKNIISTYCDAFERLDTNNRISMVHLLKTWVGVLPQAKVSAIQERISSFVPSNPSPQAANQPNAIHVNPKYLQRTGDGTRPATGKSNPPKTSPTQQQTGKGAPPAKPTSAPGKAAPPPAAGKGTTKVAPSSLKSAPTTKPGTPPTTTTTGKPGPATAKPGAPKPPVKPSGTASTPAGTQPPPVAGAKGAPVPNKPVPPNAKGKVAPPGARPALKSSPVKKEGGEDVKSVPGRGRGVPPAGAKPPGVRPTDGKELKPTGRGRVEHQSKLSEEREHPYRRPPSKFGEKLMEKGFDGLGQKNAQPDQQSVIDQAQTILQALEQGNQPENKQLLDVLRGFVQSKDTSSVLPMLQQYSQQQSPLNSLLNMFDQKNMSPQAFNNQQGGFNQYNNQFPQYSQYSQFQQYPQFQNQFSQFPQFQNQNQNQNQQFPQFNANQNQTAMPGQQPQRQGFIGFQPKSNVMGMNANAGMGMMNPGMGMGVGMGMGMNTGVGAGMNVGMGGGMGMNAGGVTPGGITRPLPPSPIATGPITDLKRQDRSVVNKLYNEFNLQCKICALRFNDSEKMAKHLDWHFASNRKEKMRAKQAMSRPWYITTEEWAESQGSEASEKASTPFFEAETEDVAVEAPEASVIADESQPICPICHEKFEQYWDSEDEEWMYRGTMINPVNGTIVHTNCFNPDPPSSSSSSPPTDATMTSPPTSPRANTPMEIITTMTTSTTTITTTLPLSNNNPSSLSPPSGASFSGVHGIDDLSF